MAKMKNCEENLNEVLDSNIDDIGEIKKSIQGLVRSDIKLIGKNESQKRLIRSIKSNEITICAGRPGTGKTFVSLAYALSLLRKNTNKYKTIYLVKSVTTLKGEELGFLKGDMKDKIEPFMWSFYINMEKIINTTSVQALVNENIVKPFPLAYMRDASLDNCIIIADEMQNVSIDNAKTLLTRIGTDSKLILLGDVNQIDMRRKEDSSLSKLIDMFIDVENIGAVKMDDNDINVRNPLISVIENKFNETFNDKE